MLSLCNCSTCITECFFFLSLRSKGSPQSLQSEKSFFELDHFTSLLTGTFATEHMVLPDKRQRFLLVPVQKQKENWKHYFKIKACNLCSALVKNVKYCSDLELEIKCRPLFVWSVCPDITQLLSDSHTPAVRVFSSFRLLWRWGGRCCGVGTRVGAAPAWMRSTEGEGPFSTEAVWQQALLVQIGLRIGTAHLTAHTKDTETLPRPTTHRCIVHLMLCNLAGYNKLEYKNRKKSSTRLKTPTQATRHTGQTHTSIIDL